MVTSSGVDNVQSSLCPDTSVDLNEEEDDVFLDALRYVRVMSLTRKLLQHIRNFSAISSI